ncbi:MAG: hypothetical protein WC209_16890 [Ignavibacteriaceae bacterium]
MGFLFTNIHPRWGCDLTVGFCVTKIQPAKAGWGKTGLKFLNEVCNKDENAGRYSR